MTSFARRTTGHLRTIGHLLRCLLRPPVPPPAEAWRGELEDPVAGRVEVSGSLARVPAARGAIVVLIHGLGGSADSPYLCDAATAAADLGLDTLRLNLRGADPVARDFYHGGLTAELHAAVADRALAGYERIGVLGYSMGGHVALRFAAETTDPRLAAVAAVCAPLHLATVSRQFDRPSRALYRFWVLRHLRRCFAELEARGARLPRPFAEVRRATTFRQWDSVTVVPRFGFADADDYYARASAAATIDRLRVPGLLLASEIDPVITPRAIEPYLPAGAVVAPADRLDDLPPSHACGAGLRVLWHRDAGHVAFPERGALERRLLLWLAGSPAATVG